MDKLKTLWKVAQFPLIVGVIVVTVYAGWVLLRLPPQDETVAILKGYITQWGYPIVFAGSFLEALLLLGWYFPGSILIFLSVALAPNPFAAMVAVIFVTLGLYSAYIVNFYLGKYGWYRLLLAFGIRKQLEDAQEKLSRYGVRAIFMSYWHPNLASFIATAAGILQYSPRRFLTYSLVATLLWNIFWGVLVYALGEQSLDIFLSWPFLVLVLIIWISARYIEERISLKRDSLQNL